MIRLALPSLAEETLVLMVTWTDWFLASRYFVEDGDATKAAMGLMAYMMWLIPHFFSVIAVGATALIARRIGANRLSAASETANQAYLVASALAVVMTAIVWIYADPFIALMQLNGDAADYAAQYLRIVTVVIPWVMASQIGAACLRGAGDTMSGFVIKIIVVIVNIAVSTVLVTGWGFLPQVGWQGIAIGTASGYVVGGSIITWLLVRGRAGLRLKLASMRPNFSILKTVFRIGVPAGFDILTLMFSQLLFLSLINSLGKASAAAHGLAVQVEACAFLPGSALYVAATTMAGQFLGAGKPRQASTSVLQCLGVGAAIMATCSAVLYFYGLEVATGFTGDRLHPTTIQVAHLLKIVACALPSLAVVMIVTGGLRGAGDTTWMLLFTIVGFFVIRIPLAIYLCFDQYEIPWLKFTVTGLDMGVAGAWYAMAVDLIIRSVLIMARFFHGGWRNVKI